jgi:hypothetical protein
MARQAASAMLHNLLGCFCVLFDAFGVDNVFASEALLQMHLNLSTLRTTDSSRMLMYRALTRHNSCKMGA